MPDIKKPLPPMICKFCGKEFTPKRAGAVPVCYGEHTIKCMICGTEFHPTREKLVSKDFGYTCSDACTRRKRSLTLSRITRERKAAGLPHI